MRPWGSRYKAGFAALGSALCRQCIGSERVRGRLRPGAILAIGDCAGQNNEHSFIYGLRPRSALCGYCTGAKSRILGRYRLCNTESANRGLCNGLCHEFMCRTSCRSCESCQNPDFSWVLESARRPGPGRPTFRTLASLACQARDNAWLWISPGGVTRPISEGAFPEMGVVSHRGTESTQGWKPGKPFLAKDAKVAKVRKDWVEGSKYLDVSWQSLRTWREIMPGFGFCREGAPGLPLTGPPCANPGRFASGGVPG